MSIVGIGRAFVDFVVEVSEAELNTYGLNIGCAQADEYDEINRIIAKFQSEERGKILPGGPVANTMAMIAHLGGNANFIGKVGSDQLGNVFRQDFESRSVRFKIDQLTLKETALAIVFVTPDAERTVFYNDGVADHITEHDIELNRNALSKAKFLYLGLPYRNPVCDRVINIAKGYANDAQIVTTLQSYQAGSPDDALRILEADIIVGNEAEYAEFLKDVEGTEKFSELPSSYPEKVFIKTLGSKGVHILTKSGREDVPAVSVAKPKDTTGAGDAWIAGFLFNLSQGLPFRAAATHANNFAKDILNIAGGRLPLKKTLDKPDITNRTAALTSG